MSECYPATAMNGPTAIRVGCKAPFFEIETFDPKTQAFGKLSLNDLNQRNKWAVLVFYPADFTFVCPTELADIAEKQEAMAGLGAEIISISTDTKFAHLAWRKSEKLLEKVQFLMGSDPGGKVAQMYGVYDATAGTALRGSFIIDPEGTLVSIHVHARKVGRNSDELLRELEANVYLADHPNEACPAKWVPGAQTLTPATEMVGNVYDALHQFYRNIT